MLHCITESITNWKNPYNENYLWLFSTAHLNVKIQCLIIQVFSDVKYFSLRKLNSVLFCLFVWDLRLNIKRLLTICLFPYLLQASWDEREFCFSLSFIHRLIIIINISDNQTSKVMVICTITSIHTYIEHPDKTNAHRVNAHSANSILWVIHGVKSAD